MNTLQTIARSGGTLLLLLGLVPGAVLAEELDGRRIMEQVDRQNRSQDEVVEAKMLISQGSGAARERQLTMTVKGGDRYEDRTLIRFSAPGDIRDTGFLIHQHGSGEDELWMYLPGLKKTKRLAATERKDPFVGSDFANEDLRTENLLAYDYKLLRQETLQGANCWVIEALPATDSEKRNSGYRARQLWVSPDLLIRRIEFFVGEAKEPVKTLEFLDYRTQESWKGFQRADRAVMTHHKKGSKTEFLFEGSKRKVNQGIDAAQLSQRALEKI